MAYDATLDSTVRLRDCLPEAHLARFVANLVAQLNLAPFYARYSQRGGSPYEPEVLLSLLFYIGDLPHHLSRLAA